jgi:chromosome segregation ATPase
MSARPDLREEERRKRDEVRLAALQTQVDELRSLVRELSSRQVRGEEQFRNYEASISQLRSQVEQHRHEVAQASQARAIDDARLRQQLTEIDARIDESVKPVRALQAHVSEILETIRRGRDDDQDDLRRFTELRTQIDHIAALAERNSDVIQLLRDSTANLRTDLEQTDRNTLKNEDSIRIVEQDARRRIAETHQEIENISIRLEEVRPIFGQLEAQIADVRDSGRHIDPALDALARTDERQQAEINRYYTQSNERDDLLGERIDELRVQQEIGFRDIRQNVEQRFERVSERLDSLADIDRELAYRLNMIEMRLDELADADVRLRRELWHLEEMRVRRRFDQIQQDLEAAAEGRRTAESELAREKPTRQQPRDRSEGIS